MGLQTLQAKASNKLMPTSNTCTLHIGLQIQDLKYEVRSEFPQFLFHSSISDALKACTYSKTGAVTSVQMSLGNLTPLPLSCGIVQLSENTLIPQIGYLSPHLLLTAVLVRVQLHQQLAQHTATFSQVFLLFLS